jgi:EmrB/QacA subfamily drug resistance transporter
MPLRTPQVTDVPVGSSARGGRGSGGGHGALVMVLCAGIFMVYLDGTVVNVALPEIQTDLGGGITQLQWVVDIYALAFAALLLTSGVAGDIVGRRRMFLAGLASFTLASGACALADSMGTLLVARAFQGAAGSALIPVSLALITQLYSEPAARAKMIGLWAGVGGTALAAGPVLGGVLLDHYSWQSVFWVNVPVGVVATVALARLLPRTRGRADGRLDPLGQLLFVASMCLLTFALIEGNTRGWGSAAIVTAFGGAVVTLASFVWWQLRTSHPLLPLALFRNPWFACACAVNFLGLFGLFAVIFLMTLYLQTINGFTPVATGVRLLALTASIMVASAVAPSAAKRFGARSTIVVGSVVTAVACLGLTQLEVGSPFRSYGWGLVLLGVGISMCAAPATVVLLSSVPSDHAGTAAGVSNTFRQIGGVFGVAMAGAVVLHRFRTTLPPTVQALPVPLADKREILDAIERGDLSRLWRLSDGLRQATLGRVAEEFVAGMHTAFVVAAVGGLLSGVVALAYMRVRPRHRLGWVASVRSRGPQPMPRHVPARTTRWRRGDHRDATAGSPAGARASRANSTGSGFDGHSRSRAPSTAACSEKRWSGRA